MIPIFWLRMIEQVRPFRALLLIFRAEANRIVLRNSDFGTLMLLNNWEKTGSSICGFPMWFIMLTATSYQVFFLRFRPSFTNGTKSDNDSRLTVKTSLTGWCFLKMEHSTAVTHFVSHAASCQRMSGQIMTDTLEYGSMSLRLSSSITVYQH